MSSSMVWTYENRFRAALSNFGPHLAKPVERQRDAPFAVAPGASEVIGRALGRRLAKSATVQDLRCTLRKNRHQLDVHDAQRLALLDDDVDGSRPVFSGSGLSDPVMRPTLTPRTTIAAALRARPGTQEAATPARASELNSRREYIGYFSASPFGRAMS